MYIKHGVKSCRLPSAILVRGHVGKSQEAGDRAELTTETLKNLLFLGLHGDKHCHPAPPFSVVVKLNLFIP